MTIYLAGSSIRAGIFVLPGKSFHLLPCWQEGKLLEGRDRVFRNEIEDIHHEGSFFLNQTLLSPPSVQQLCPQIPGT